jgi:ATPase subunit of ABC transporter with duplicated ATPase domains
MAKQAQSRMKQLAKLQEEEVEVDMDDPYLRLEFPAAPELPPPCISVQNAAFKYPGSDRVRRSYDLKRMGTSGKVLSNVGSAPFNLCRSW